MTFFWAGEIWRVGVVRLRVLACVLRATTKKVVNFLKEKVHPKENPGIAYGNIITSTVNQWYHVTSVNLRSPSF